MRYALQSLIVTALVGIGTACGRAQLATPDAGSCSAETAANRWPQFEGTDGAPPLVTETGWGVGQVPPDFQLVDQFGDPVCLWQMVGNYVVLDSSTQWCEPCKRIAATVACQQETYGDLVYMTFIVQDAGGNPASAEHAEQWSDAFGLGEGTLTPVVADGGAVGTSQFPGDGGFPTLVLLDPELRVVVAGSSEGTEQEIREALDEALGVSADACLE
ncbi:MAG: thioredoxin family protein [Myxococcota bacterium]